MRTFIALELPGQLRTAIGELSGTLRSELGEMKWVRPGNIHLTLRFLGEIDQPRLPDVSSAVAGAAAEVPPFELRVAEVGHFGSPRNPRVLWLGLEQEEHLSSLAAGIENRLEAAGFGRADKPFRAHLTLARAGKKPGPPPDWQRLASLTPDAWPLWPIEEVCVIESTLTPRGPIYDIQSRHQLEG